MKRKLNWIDYGLILLAIAVVSILGIKFGVNQELSTEKELQERVVEIEVRGVRNYTVDAVKEGDALYSNDMKHYFGEIVGVDSKPSTEIMITDSGDVLEVEVPERYILGLQVRTDISERDTGYYSEGVTEIKVNSIGSYRTDRVQFSGTVTSISEPTYRTDYLQIGEMTKKTEE